MGALVHLGACVPPARVECKVHRERCISARVPFIYPRALGFGVRGCPASVYLWRLMIFISPVPDRCLSWLETPFTSSGGSAHWRYRERCARRPPPFRTTLYILLPRPSHLTATTVRKSLLTSHTRKGREKAAFCMRSASGVARK